MVYIRDEYKTIVMIKKPVWNELKMKVDSMLIEELKPLPEEESQEELIKELIDTLPIYVLMKQHDIEDIKQKFIIKRKIIHNGR